MALMHRCPNGTATRLTRTGPVGTLEGVTLSCLTCGYSKSAIQSAHDFEALRPTIVAALADADRKAGAERKAGERALALENQRAARELGR
jgi:hypothetical protein